MSRFGHVSGRHPLCPNCGYDLIATVDAGRTICPECGYEFEAHELKRDVRPGDWTVWRGLRRMFGTLLIRAAACFVGWAAVLWAANALLNHLGPAVSPVLRFILIFVAAAVIFTAGALVGHLLARRMEEHAGFVSILLVFIITVIAWAVILLGVLLVQSVGGLGAKSSTGVLIVAAGLSFIFIIRALYFSD